MDTVTRVLASMWASKFALLTLCTPIEYFARARWRNACTDPWHLAFTDTLAAAAACRKHSHLFQMLLQPIVEPQEVVQGVQGAHKVLLQLSLLLVHGLALAIAILPHLFLMLHDCNVSCSQTWLHLRERVSLPAQRSCPTLGSCFVITRRPINDLDLK